MRQQFGVHRVVGGKVPVTYRPVLITLENHRVVALEPLTGEPQHTIWLGGCAVLSLQVDNAALPPLPMAFDDVVATLASNTIVINAWHITPQDCATGWVQQLTLL